MRGARLRLASLWVAQVSRFLGDWCLRMVAVREWAGAAREGRLTAWHVATAVFVAPFVVLAPLNGCVCNALPRRRVLVASSLFTLLAVAGFAAVGSGWMVCLGAVALGSAVHTPARYAVLPAGAREARLSLPRVNGWFEMGLAVALVGGAGLGWFLPGPDWPQDGRPLAARAVAVLVGLNLVCFLASLPVWFPTDLRRKEGAIQAVAGFFRDCARVVRHREAGASLFALSGFQALVTAGSGAVVALALYEGGSASESDLLWALGLVSVGTALGCLAVAAHGHPRRTLGFVALGGLGLVVALVWASASPPGAPLPWLPCLLLGFMTGLANVPLRSAYLAAVPADARGNGMSVINTSIYVFTAALALALVGLVEVGLLTTPGAQLLLIAGLTAVGTGLAFWLLRAPTVELLAEWLIAPLYRVRTYGPGAGKLPEEGPLLVVANHSAWLDPVWLMKVMPRRVTPMMTSLFFDLPGLRWLVTHIVGAIRVPAIAYRREAPELKEAVEELRRGGCVLIFPESMLRRGEEQVLRLFAQGVWHILRELPETPVMVCWIEGGWGSFTSWRWGPPLRNKRPDWWRRIDIALEEPQVLDPALLADQRATRLHLMRMCLRCRRYLGLEVPDTPWTREAQEPAGAVDA